VIATPANVADSAVLSDLLHGRETRVWGDQAIAVRRRSSGRTPQGRATSSIAAIVITVWWIRPSGPRTVPSQRCVPRSNSHDLTKSRGPLFPHF
jgi:hypothetical protein